VTRGRHYDGSRRCSSPTWSSVARFEYSNLGGGLLGYLLARRAGMGCEALVQARITGPLGMTSTTIRLSPDQRVRLAAGHNARLAPVPDWTFDALAGCGALRSTAHDMQRLLAAFLGETSTPLAPAMAAICRPAGPFGAQVGLGWIVSTPAAGSGGSNQR
jgi:serine-type D-Ala-D-Ala carboxypeptidase/endopeptidase